MPRASLASSFDSPTPPETRWQRLANVVVRRRVRITAILFLILVVEDLLIGVQPHDLFNLGDWKSDLGLLLVVAGIALRAWAAGILTKNTQLSRGGPYQIVRHPLYVGSYLMMVGFCILIDDWENIWIVLGPFLAFYLWRIRREERGLSERFGQLWTDYAERVPRFIPRRWPKDAFSEWRLGQWLENREYRAAIAAAVGLMGVELWERLV